MVKHFWSDLECKPLEPSTEETETERRHFEGVQRQKISNKVQYILTYPKSTFGNLEVHIIDCHLVPAFWLLKITLLGPHVKKERPNSAGQHLCMVVSLQSGHSCQNERLHSVLLFQNPVDRIVDRDFCNLLRLLKRREGLLKSRQRRFRRRWLLTLHHVIQITRLLSLEEKDRNVRHHMLVRLSPKDVPCA